MTSSDMKPLALEAVKRAAATHHAVTFRDVRAAIQASAVTVFFDNRVLDRALQALRREKAIRYLAKLDPKTGKPRKRWGWIPAGKAAR